MNNSRFITYPSTVEANSNYKVVVVDAVEQELEQLKRFLQTSTENFDVHLYLGTQYDLEWLNDASADAEFVLINNDSHVNVTPVGIRYQNNLIEYFEQFEQTTVDTHN
jgi:hypothetical protein